MTMKAKKTVAYQWLDTICCQPLNRKLMLILALICFELAVGYSLDIRKLSWQLQQVQQTQFGTAQAIVAEQQQLIDYRNLQTKFTSWQRGFANALQPLKQPLSTSQLLQQLSAQAEHTGLELQSIHPGKSRIAGVFIVQPIHLQAVADYQLFARFIDNLVKIPAVLDIVSLELGVNQNPRQLTIDLVLNTYTFAPPASPDKSPSKTNVPLLQLKKLTHLPFTAMPSRKIRGAVRNPFAYLAQTNVLSFCQQQELLLCFPENNYQILGTIQHGQQNRAIVLDPQGNLHDVTVGMRLGNRQGYIQSIDTKTMTLVVARDIPAKLQKIGNVKND